MPVNLITGDDTANTLSGTVNDDVIYGFNPEGPQGTVTSIAATRVATGLDQPLFAVAPNGDLNRLFLVEKTGHIKILDLTTGNVLATPFLDVSTELTTNGERGLLGLTFDPDYAHNGFFYVNLTNLAGDTEIRRYHVSADANVADAASETLVITVDQPGFNNHKAGWLGFGPDGYLYAALGDGGSGGDPDNNAQNIDSLLGKMLRLDVHGDDFAADPTRNYAIPAGNMFAGLDGSGNPIPGADEIWAMGLRNPWRDSFDRALGTFYIADVGQSNFEEIDIGVGGANYGWNVWEGHATYPPGTSPPGTTTGGTLTFPIHDYDRSIGASITGGYVYRGESEGLQGVYFFGDFSRERMFTLHLEGSTWVRTERTAQIHPDVGTLGAPSSFGEDARGNLYVVDFDGDVFRLTPTVVSADQGDMLSGGLGNDRLYGGSGADTLDGGSGADVLLGGPGSDRLEGGTGPDLIIGGDGFDYAKYAFAAAPVVADLANPALNTSDAAGDAYNAIEGIVGSAFGDTLSGDGAVNDLAGLDGDDVIDARAGNDNLQGGNGDDTLTGGAGADRIVGGSGFDHAKYGDAPAGVIVNLTTASQNTGEAAGDTYGTVEGLIGSAFADTLVGGNDDNDVQGLDGSDSIEGRAGNDTLAGGEGNDNLEGGAGADALDGGNGFDYARYRYAPGFVGTSLDGSLLQAGEAGGDSYTGVEGLVGSLFGDALGGDAGMNDLAGLAGDDLLFGRGNNDNLQGGDGNDRIDGGPGADRMIGGTGNDTFVQRAGETQGDMIVDFASGDRIEFNGYGLSAAGANVTSVDATHYRVTSADTTISEVFALSNVYVLTAADYTFI